MSQHESNQKEDLDAFLISLESKLRGPFSSLDWARAVSSAASSRSSSPREYLQTIIQILPKMDKVVKLRLCVGLLGLEPSEDTDDVVYDILTQAQEAPLHEEWVRVVACVCRGIMFSNDGSRDSCRGEEARNLLEKTCKDILQRVDEGSSSSSEKTCDLDPLFAPFHYSLLDADVVKEALPECLSNPHFQVNQDAEILQVDQKLAAATQSALNEKAPSASSVAVEPVMMPGMRSMMSSSSSKTNASTSKSSMFIPAKRPTAGSAVGSRQLAAMRKAPVHARKAGAAQSLLAKGRKLGQLTGAARAGGAASSTAGARGRAMKYGNNRSKMKMIDVAEVQGLQERDSKMAETETKESKLNARKRKIMEAAAAKGLVSESTVKKAKSDDTEKPGGVGNTNGRQAEAATGVGMGNTNADTAPTEAPAPNRPAESAPPPEAPSTDKQDWRQLLEKANKLSADDRFRVKAFFTDRFNPTPDVPVVKMKLHEEKMIDSETNKMVKETLYLELDYNSFTFKKLRKTKKYD